MNMVEREIIQYQRIHFVNNSAKFKPPNKFVLLVTLHQIKKITISHTFLVFFKVHKMKLNYLYMSLRVSNVDHVRFKLPTTFTFCTRVFQEKLDVAKTIYIFCQYDNRMPKMYFFSSRKPLKRRPLDPTQKSKATFVKMFNSS